MISCQQVPQEQSFMKLESKYESIHSRKYDWICRLQNWFRPFCLVLSMLMSQQHWSVDPLTNGQWCRKRFHVIKSSWISAYEPASVIPLTKHMASIIVTIDSDQLLQPPTVHASDLIFNNVCCLFYHYTIKFASGYRSWLTVTIINEYHWYMLTTSSDCRCPGATWKDLIQH